MSVLGEKTILAIDPGEKKCGVVIATRDVAGKLDCIFRTIIPKEDLTTCVEKLLTEHGLKMVIIGNGTGSRTIIEQLRQAWSWVSFLVVDERDTTMEARELYWLIMGRRGWRRLLPSSLQVPPVPYDDFAALVLAYRVLSGS